MYSSRENSSLATPADAALAPLKRYLNGWQTRLVRSIVQANIEAAPVSRRPVPNALHVRPRSHWRASRLKGGKQARRKRRELERVILPNRTQMNDTTESLFLVEAVLHDLTEDAEALLVLAQALEGRAAGITPMPGRSSCARWPHSSRALRFSWVRPQPTWLVHPNACVSSRSFMTSPMTVAVGCRHETRASHICLEGRR